MIDWEVLALRLAPFLLLAAFALVPAVALALLAAGAYAFQKQVKHAGIALVSVPLMILVAVLLLQSACVARVIVADISSPQAEFRARIVMRDAGATTSWGLDVEVGRRGLIGWNWTRVFHTYRDVPAEIQWMSATRLLVRHHPSKYAERLTTVVDGVTVQFEDCPTADPNASWSGVYRNGC